MRSSTGFLLADELRILGIDPGQLDVAELKQKLVETQQRIKLGVYKPPDEPLEGHKKYKKKDVLRLIFGSKTEFDDTLSVYSRKST